MAKEYFSHDYHCRANTKIRDLLRAHGWAAYGLWWAIVEDLYNSGNRIAADYASISYDLRSDEGVIRSIIEDFGLFLLEDGYISSESVAERLLKREEKSYKAKNAAKSRWNSNDNAGAMQTHSERNAYAMQHECERNALNKSKVNKIKRKKRIVSDAPTDAAEAALSPELKMRFERLQDWISINAPQVAKMDEPLTAGQLGELLKKFTSVQISDILLKMHNRTDLLKKNRSANLTIRNWLNRELSAGPPGPSTTAKQSALQQNMSEAQRAKEMLKQIIANEDEPHYPNQ